MSWKIEMPGYETLTVPDTATGYAPTGEIVEIPVTTVVSPSALPPLLGKCRVCQKIGTLGKSCSKCGCIFKCLTHCWVCQSPTGRATICGPCCSEQYGD